MTVRHWPGAEKIELRRANVERRSWRGAGRSGWQRAEEANSRQRERVKCRSGEDRQSFLVSRSGRKRHVVAVARSGQEHVGRKNGSGWQGVANDFSRDDRAIKDLEQLRQGFKRQRLGPADVRGSGLLVNQVVRGIEVAAT